MKLSELAFLAVKNAILYDDDSFDYDTFVEGKWRNSADYGLSINNVFIALNNAFSRLSSLERIPHKIIEIKPIDNFIELPNDCASIVGIGVFTSTGVVSNEFSLAGPNRIYAIKGATYEDGKMSVEYKPVINFQNMTEDHDLKEEYGIDDNMCQTIIEYAKGVLTEDISPEVANMHITRAEQYFAGLPVITDTFIQRTVRPDYKIGE